MFFVLIYSSQYIRIHYLFQVCLGTCFRLYVNLVGGGQNGEKEVCKVLVITSCIV